MSLTASPSWPSSTLISKWTHTHTTNKKAIVYQDQAATNLARIWFSEVSSLTINSLHRASASIWEAIRSQCHSWGRDTVKISGFSGCGPEACWGRHGLRDFLQRGPTHAERQQHTWPGKVPQNGRIFHLRGVGKEGDVGSRSRTRSLTRIPCHFTAWYKRRIFDKTRQNSQGKENSCSFCFSISHRQCRAEIAPPAFPCRGEQFVFWATTKHNCKPERVNSFKGFSIPRDITLNSHKPITICSSSFRTGRWGGLRCIGMNWSISKTRQ